MIGSKQPQPPPLIPPAPSVPLQYVLYGLMESPPERREQILSELSKYSQQFGVFNDERNTGINILLIFFYIYALF